MSLKGTNDYILAGDSFVPYRDGKFIHDIFVGMLPTLLNLSLSGTKHEIQRMVERIWQNCFRLMGIKAT